MIARHLGKSALGIILATVFALFVPSASAQQPYFFAFGTDSVGNQCKLRSNPTPPGVRIAVVDGLPASWNLPASASNYYERTTSYELVTSRTYAFPTAIGASMVEVPVPTNVLARPFNVRIEAFPALNGVPVGLGGAITITCNADDTWSLRSIENNIPAPFAPGASVSVPVGDALPALLAAGIALLAFFQMRRRAARSGATARIAG